MAQRNREVLVIADLRGGRNGYDEPTMLAANECVEAENIDWRGGVGLGRKRAGNVIVTLTGTAGAIPAEWLYRHVPGNDETAAELWQMVFNAGFTDYLLQRVVGGTAKADITTVDTWSSTNPLAVMGATFNGKLFLAGDTNVNYLHCWDGTTFRRVGITVPAAATVANTGSGSYAATLRYYKVAYTVQSGGVTLRRSELSPLVSFTPSGSGTAARVTKPAATSPTCGETHWELYGSADDTSYSLLATTAVGTTTVDDTSDPTTYSVDFPTGAPLAGTNTPPPSCKYVIAFNNRLVMAGAWETSGGETTPKNNRIWFTPVLGSSDIGDDERVPSANYLDINENSGAYITGLAELFGDVYVFMSEAIWVLHATGDVDAPFEARRVSGALGSLNQRAIVAAEDHAGHPALYFPTKRGMYQLGVGGLTYIGRGIEDLWSAVSIDTRAIRMHGLFYVDARQIWWWSGETASPKVFVYDVSLNAWSQFTGGIAYGYASCLFSNTMGASMSRDLKPYVSGAITKTLSDKIVKCDTGTQDLADNNRAEDEGGPAITATITLKPYTLGNLEYQVRVDAPILEVTTAAGAVIECRYRPNFGEQDDVVDTHPLDGDGTHLRVVFDGLQTADVYAVQPILSNTDANGAGWTLTRLILRYSVEGPTG